MIYNTEINNKKNNQFKLIVRYNNKINNYIFNNN